MNYGVSNMKIRGRLKTHLSLRAKRGNLVADRLTFTYGGYARRGDCFTRSSFAMTKWGYVSVYAWRSCTAGRLLRSFLVRNDKVGYVNVYT